MNYRFLYYFYPKDITKGTCALNVVNNYKIKVRKLLENRIAR